MQKNIDKIFQNTVTAVSFEGTPLSAQQVQQLCEALSKNTVLTKLNLRDTRLQSQDIQALSKVISKHPSLVKVVIDKAEDDSAEVRAALQAIDVRIKANSTARRLTSGPFRSTKKSDKPPIDNILERKWQVRNVGYK